MSKKMMSTIDRAWLRMDGTNNRMVINAIMLFDGLPNIARLQDAVVTGLARHPRFRQKVIGSFGRDHWVDDPAFHISRHFNVVDLDAQYSKQAVEAHLSSLAAVAIDVNSPLWTMTLVHGVGDGFAIIWRLHHCVVDGMGLMQVLEDLTAPYTAVSAGGDGVEPLLTLAPPPDMRTGTLAPVLRKTLSRLGWLARIPVEAVKLLAMPSDSRTRLKGLPSVRKQMSWGTSLPLHDVKAVGALCGATVNDVLCAVYAGAFRTYLHEAGENPAGKSIRAAIPVDLRDARASEVLGNELGLVALKFDIGLHDPLSRLANVRTQMNQIKRSPQAWMTKALLKIAGALPVAVQRYTLNMFLSKGTAVITNIKGPEKIRSLGNHPIKEVVVWVPQTGNIGIGASIVSYGGKVFFGMLCDEQLMPNPSRFLQIFAKEYETLALMARGVRQVAQRQEAAESGSIRLDPQMPFIDQRKSA